MKTHVISLFSSAHLLDLYDHFLFDHPADKLLANTVALGGQILVEVSGVFDFTFAIGL